LKLLLLGHLYRAIYLTRDIFDTGEHSSLENQPFVRDSTLVPDAFRSPKALQSITSWFDRPHLRRDNGGPYPWVYHCPIAPALAAVLGWEDPQKLGMMIAHTVQKSIPGNHPILGELRIFVGDQGWLSFDVQQPGLLAWLDFVDPSLWPVDRSTHVLDQNQLWVCQHHHARLSRHPIGSTTTSYLPESEWQLLGAVLDTIDQIEGLKLPLKAPLALKLADRLVKESDRSLAGSGSSHCPLTQLQVKTQQLIAWFLVEGCGQIAPIRL
jgi:hypothetical protein